VTAELTMIVIKTSCCSSDSERLHRCCHLANNFDPRQIFPILHNRLGDAPKLPFFEDPSPPETWFFGPVESTSQNNISIGSSVFVGFSVVSDATTEKHRHADGPRYVCNNRPHLMPCVAMRLKAAFTADELN